MSRRATRKPGPITWAPAERSQEAPIAQIAVSAYTVPTDAPEADGTIAWNATTLVLVEITAGGETGLGFVYASAAAARVIQDTLEGELLGMDALDIPACHQAMLRAVRNIIRPGIATCAIAAVDIALWDLKAKCVGLPLAKLFGVCRDAVALYGSGGFTSYSLERLCAQLEGWVESGLGRVKMKVGTVPEQDLRRVRAAREAIGAAARLFVDANGAYTRKQALAFAEAFAEAEVSWFEEPVSSDDLEGLRLLRDRAPAGMAVAAGEYGTDPVYFRRMLESGAVDVLQIDATRALGLTGFLRASALAGAFMLPVSSHTAPSVHLHACLAAPEVVHMEYFYDHVRIERMFFEGVTTPKAGLLEPDWSRPGLGLSFKRQDAARFAV